MTKQDEIKVVKADKTTTGGKAFRDAFDKVFPSTVAALEKYLKKIEGAG